jgi:glycosidase
VYLGLQELIELRKRYDVFSGGKLEVIATENDHVLGFIRTRSVERAVVFANFSEDPQILLPHVVERISLPEMKPVYGSTDLQADEGLQVGPLEFLVLSGK